MTAGGLRRYPRLSAFGPRLASNMGMKLEDSFVANGRKGEEMQHGKYFAMIRPDGEVFRFVIRDRAGSRPSIHGYGRSMDEARTKIDEILGALDDLEERAA